MFGTFACLASLASLIAVMAAAAPEEENIMARDKRALAPLQAYVGAWRGVGLPKRGSNAGAWTESSAWAWRFDKGRAELVARLDDAKYYVQLQVRPGEKPAEFVVLAAAAGRNDEQADAPPERFVGALDDGVLTVTAEKPLDRQPARISIRLVADGDRMLVRYEKRVAEGVYARLAEVGSTRKGSSFAKNASAGPECVVTGGLGTIAVTHNGKTYYVCCGGCRDLFTEDPEGVLEEYRRRKEAERTKNDE